MGCKRMYENKQDGEDWDMPKERDPFYEAADSKTFLGTAIVFLQPLAYLMDSEEAYPIVDPFGNELGEISVLLAPCNTAGKELLGEYVDDPQEMIGKAYGFMVKILSARGLPRRIDKSSCKYYFFDEKEATTTSLLSGNCPSFSHERIFTYTSISEELVDYLLNSNLCITLWGTQKAAHLSRTQNSERQSSAIDEPRRSKRSHHSEKSKSKRRTQSTPGVGSSAHHSASSEKSSKHQSINQTPKLLIHLKDPKSKKSSSKTRRSPNPSKSDQR